MNVNEIVSKFLEVKGYDGIWNPDGECACSVGGFEQCDMSMGDCQPGHKNVCADNCSELITCRLRDDGHTWCISKEKK